MRFVCLRVCLSIPLEMSERPFERLDQFAAKDRCHNFKANRTPHALDEALIRPDRKRRLGHKSDYKDEPNVKLRLDHRSPNSLAYSCSSIKCSSSVNNRRPVNFRSPLQCNLPTDNSSTHHRNPSRERNSTLSRSPFDLSQPNRHNREPRFSDSLANRSSVHPPTHNCKFIYHSSLRSPPAKRSKAAGQSPLQPSPGSDSPPARLDNQRKNSSSAEVNCSRSSALSATLPAGDKENNFNNFRDHENDTRFANCDKAVDHQSDDHHREDQQRTDGSRHKVSSHKNETVSRAKNCDSGKDDSNAPNDPSTSLQQPNSNHSTRQPPAEQPSAVPLETNHGGDLVDRQRSKRIRRFLTCTGPVNDVEYWRLKCERLSRELKLALDELDDLENENELLELELAELRKLSKESHKLKHLLQMLGL